MQVPFVQVTVSATSEFRYGDYQLWLLDQNGRPLIASVDQSTTRPVRLEPIRLASVASNHPAVQQQATKIATVAAQPGRTQITGKISDPSRELGRANQVMDKLNQLGAEGMPGLDPGSLAAVTRINTRSTDSYAQQVVLLVAFPPVVFQESSPVSMEPKGLAPLAANQVDMEAHPCQARIHQICSRPLLPATPD